MEIRTTGYYKVIKNGKQVDRHSDDKKAIATAVRYGGAIIIPPDKITVTIKGISPDSIETTKVEDQ